MHNLSEQKRIERLSCEARMSLNDKPKATWSAEEDKEVFVDAVTSPKDTCNGDCAQAPPTGPRRSARKRKSVTETIDLEPKSKSVGKRHRLLGLSLIHI